MFSYTEVTEQDSGQQIYVKSDSVRITDILGCAGGAIAPTAHAARDRNKTYVFRKMGEREFNATIAEQKLMPARGNPYSGEKWLTEHLDHSRVFENRGVTGPSRVAEIAVQKNMYADMRGNAIPQHGSRSRQPRRGTQFNITNTERLGHRTGYANVGLKGKTNVERFNEHVLSVREVDPHSFVNKHEASMWCRRNKINAALGAVGIAIDVGYVTISVIRDDGSFGENTQIALGEIAGGIVGAEAAVSIGTAIGAAVGSVVPALGTAVIGFIGGLIGAIIGGGLVRALRFWFCGGPAATEPGAPYS